MGFAPTVNLVEMRFTVLVDGYTHILKQRGLPEQWPLTPGAAATAYNFVAHDATLVTFAAAAEAYLGAIDDFYPSADASFGIVEFWAYTAGSSNAIYITSHTPTVQPSDGTTYTVANEVIGTMRTNTGRTLKVTMEETIWQSAASAVWTPNAGGTIVQKLGAHMLSDDVVYVARDGSRPIALMRYFSGQNEAIFKDRYGR